MKKTIFLFGALLAVIAAACNTEKDEPQGPETDKITNELTVEYVAPFDGDMVDLEAYDSENLVVISYSLKNSDLPEGGEVSFTLQISDNAQFENAKSLPLRNTMVAIKDIQNAYTELFPNITGAVTYIRISVDLTGSDGPNPFKSPILEKRIYVYPLKSDEVRVYNKIYLIGAPSGWDINSEAMPLNEEVFGSRIYTATYDIDDGAEFRFYSELGDWDKGSIGSQVDDAAIEVSLPYNGQCVVGKGKWCFNSGGIVHMVVNLNTMEVFFTREENSSYVGSGTVNNPFSVVNVKTTSTDYTDVWVVGYIVGWIDGMTFDAGCRFNGSTDVMTNILLADSPIETDPQKCIPVQIPSGDLRPALSLGGSPGNYKKYVKINGDITKYFGVRGLKGASQFNIVE